MSNENSPDLWERLYLQSIIFRENINNKYFESEKKLVGIDGFFPIESWNSKGFISIWIFLAGLQKELRDLINICKENKTSLLNQIDELSKKNEAQASQIMLLQKQFSEKIETIRQSRAALIIASLKRFPDKPQKEIAKEFGVSGAAISHIKRRYGLRKEKPPKQHADAQISSIPAAVPQQPQN